VPFLGRHPSAHCQSVTLIVVYMLAAICFYSPRKNIIHPKVLHPVSTTHIKHMNIIIYVIKNATRLLKYLMVINFTSQVADIVVRLLTIHTTKEIYMIFCALLDLYYYLIRSNAYLSVYINIWFRGLIATLFLHFVQITFFDSKEHEYLYFIQNKCLTTQVLVLHSKQMPYK